MALTSPQLAPPRSDTAAATARAMIISRLFARVDIASLAWFRIFFGAVMFWEVCRYFKKGWIKSYFIDPNFYFKFYGFEWVAPWPGFLMYLHFLALGIFSLCVLFGLWYRISVALVFLGFTFVFLLDQSNFLNHFYMLCLISFLLIFIPAHRSLSADAALKPEIASDTAPAWALFLLRFQLGIVFFFAGVAKLNPDWLHGYPLLLWLPRKTHLPLIGPAMEYELTAYLFSYAGLIFDLFALPLLLWKRTRLATYLSGVAFNLLNALMFNIGVFPWFMIVATTIYFSPSWPRRLGIFASRHEAAAAEAPRVDLPPRRERSLVLAALAVYCGAQVLLPLRHHLYPGNVNWTEEANNFMWSMKIRDKASDIRFRVTQPDSGVTREMGPRDFVPILTVTQNLMLLHKPEMIRQFSHFLARVCRRRGGPRLEVRAWVNTSLNGRERQLMIDPEVDLAAEPARLGHAEWILPLKTPLPPRKKTRGADNTRRAN